MAMKNDKIFDFLVERSMVQRTKRLISVAAIFVIVILKKETMQEQKRFQFTKRCAVFYKFEE
jgi:hypothetical protein